MIVTATTPQQDAENYQVNTRSTREPRGINPNPYKFLQCKSSGFQVPWNLIQMGRFGTPVARENNKRDEDMDLFNRLGWTLFEADMWT
jgi:hypothetical protein